MECPCPDGNPLPLRHPEIGSVQKNACCIGTNKGRICFTLRRFFHRHRDFGNFDVGRRIDASQYSRNYGQAGVAEIASKGHVLVSSTMERRSSTTSRKTSGKTATSSRNGATAGVNEDGQVSQVLRTVYQNAVDEAIPAEMLDLLSKLD